jgi:very-short-patch-repair endonuclease
MRNVAPNSPVSETRSESGSLAPVREVNQNFGVTAQGPTLEELDLHRPNGFELAAKLDRLVQAARSFSNQSPAPADATASTREIAKNLKVLTVEDIARYAWACATLGITDQETYKQCARALEGRIHEYARHGKALSQLCWSFGTGRFNGEKFWNEVHCFLISHSGRMKPKWFTTIAQAAAHAEVHNPRLYALLAKEIIKHQAELKGDGMKRARSAYNTIELDRKTIGLILGQPIKSLDQCSPEDIQAALNAFSALGIRQNKVTRRLAGSAVAGMSSRPVKELAREAERFADSNTMNDSYYETLRQVVTQRSGECATSDIVRFAKVFSKQGMIDHELGCAVVKRTLELHSEGIVSLASFVKILESFSFAAVKDSALLQAATERLSEGIRYVDSSDLGKIALAYARLNAPSDAMFRALRGEVEARIKNAELSFSVLGQIAWGFAELRAGDREFLKLMADEFIKKPAQVFPNDAARFLLAAVVIDESVAQKLFQATADMADRRLDELNEMGATRLHWSALALGRSLGVNTRQAAEAALSSLQFAAPGQNGFERRIGEALREIGLEPKAQVPVEGYYLDFEVVAGGQKWAIECDGSKYHQVGGEFRDQLLGRGVIRDMVLNRLGYRVLRISDLEMEFTLDVPQMLREKLAA